MSQRTVKSGAQKRREKKLATLQKAATQSYSLTNYFSCASATTSEHGEAERSADADIDLEDAEGIIIYRFMIYFMKLLYFSNLSQRKKHKKLNS